MREGDGNDEYGEHQRRAGEGIREWFLAKFHRKKDIKVGGGLLKVRILRVRTKVIKFCSGPSASVGMTGFAFR